MHQELSADGESAALNGFNRILGTLNKNDPTDYRGYLLTLDNIEPSVETDPWPWEAVALAPNSGAPPLQELCIDTSNGLPTTAPQSWPRTQIQTTTGASQRSDGKGAIQLYYRLRGYASPGSSGVGEGVFEVEGIVTNKPIGGDEDLGSGGNEDLELGGENPGSGDDEYLARTLLRRSLYVQSIVAGEDNWAVMGGHHMELAGSSITNASGEAASGGQILLDVDAASAVDVGRCNDNAYRHHW